MTSIPFNLNAPRFCLPSYDQVETGVVQLIVVLCITASVMKHAALFIYNACQMFYATTCINPPTVNLSMHS